MEFTVCSLSCDWFSIAFAAEEYVAYPMKPNGKRETARSDQSKRLLKKLDARSLNELLDGVIVEVGLGTSADIVNTVDVGFWGNVVLTDR